MASELPFPREYQPPAGQAAVISALLSTLRDRHSDVADLVADLDEEALSWRPADTAASLADLARHVLDIERMVIAALSDGEDAVTETDELGTQLAIPGTSGAIIAAVAASDAALLALIEPLPADAARLRRIVAEFDHSALHHGQMQLTRDLWDAAHPNERASYEHWR